MSLSPLRGMGWCEIWHNWLAREVGLVKIVGPVSILFSIALPCALVGYVFTFLSVESSMLTFLGGAALLLWCFGPGDTGRDIELYSNAYADPSDVTGEQDMDNFLGAISGSGVTNDSAYQRAISMVSNERIFTPALWFAVLGPLGALLFRMASVLARADGVPEQERALTRRLHQILLWVPARLFALGLGLAGTLGPVLRTLSERSYPLEAADQLVGDASIAAHDTIVEEDDTDDEHVASINSMLALVKRAFAVWLAVLALAAAAGIV